ncbi:MAG: hypothetical protein HC851_15815 [Acaryochloris sp. RU_4_1]|nr:hypothetical protein [Acaryochloris sp. RU_4_1]
MKLITSIKIDLADHTEVIDSAATQVGHLASQVALAVFSRAAQDAQRVIGYGGTIRSLVDTKLLAYREAQVKPVLNEVKESAIALYRKGCQQETAFFQELIKTQVTAKVDAHWELHDKVLKWFKAKVDDFLAEKPVEGTDEVKPEQPTAVMQDLEAALPVTKPNQPISKDDSPIQVLDLPDEDAELAIPEDPAPVSAKRRAARKPTASIADLIKQEAAKS